MQKKAEPVADHAQKELNQLEELSDTDGEQTELNQMEELTESDIQEELDQLSKDNGMLDQA